MAQTLRYCNSKWLGWLGFKAWVQPYRGQVQREKAYRSIKQAEQPIHSSYLNDNTAMAHHCKGSWLSLPVPSASYTPKRVALPNVP